MHGSSVVVRSAHSLTLVRGSLPTRSARQQLAARSSQLACLVGRVGRGVGVVTGRVGRALVPTLAGAAEAILVDKEGLVGKDTKHHAGKGHEEEQEKVVKLAGNDADTKDVGRVEDRAGDPGGSSGETLGEEADGKRSSHLVGSLAGLAVESVEGEHNHEGKEELEHDGVKGRVVAVASKPAGNTVPPKVAKLARVLRHKHPGKEPTQNATHKLRSNHKKGKDHRDLPSQRKPSSHCRVKVPNTVLGRLLDHVQQSNQSGARDKRLSSSGRVSSSNNRHVQSSTKALQEKLLPPPTGVVTVKTKITAVEHARNLKEGGEKKRNGSSVFG